MTHPDRPAEAEAFADSRFGNTAAERLHDAFSRAGQPILLADDHRRWITGNAAACELLGLGIEEIPWQRMDHFTPPGELETLEGQWRAFLDAGEAEGHLDLYLPDQSTWPTEFSATRNVLPGRHLALFIGVDYAAGDVAAPTRGGWGPVEISGGGRTELTARERQIVGLVARGETSGEIADSLYLSTATVKSHVQNAMRKLGVHTRAHAVSVALVTGQIDWATENSPTDDASLGPKH